MSKRKHRDSVDELLDSCPTSPEKPDSDFPLYFEPEAFYLQSLDLTPIELQLLSSLLSTFKLGVHLYRLGQDPNRAAKNDAKPFDVAERTEAGKLCATYIKNALSSHMAGDKKYPLRLTGPSMSFISTILPALLTSHDMFQLCIFRAFAFGDLLRLQLLVLPKPGGGGKQTGTQEPDFKALLLILRGWTGPTGSGISLSAYGQFQVIFAKIPLMLERLWSFSVDLAMLWHSTAYSTPKIPPSFTSIYEMLYKKEIPSLPRGGLVVWLIACDMAEYGICTMPTINDYIEHLLSKPKVSGPSNAINAIAAHVGADPPDDIELETMLKTVWKAIEDGTKEWPAKEKFRGGPNVLQEIVKECGVVQKRPLQVMDLEHALCKISRQVKKLKVLKGEDAVVATGANKLASSSSSSSSSSRKKSKA